MLRFLRLFWLLLNHPQVGRYKKLIFVGFPVLYFLAPDIIPFFVDDLLLLVFGLWAFVNTAKGDLKRSNIFRSNSFKNKEDYIDVEARIIKDDNK
jgi:uncharacterized membrane protein YkvA (DUF1232 family)